MSFKTNKITQITGLLNEVKEADKYILQLQDMAKKLIDGKMAVELNLTGKSMDFEKVTLNDEGDMVSSPDLKKTFLISFFNPYGVTGITDPHQRKSSADFQFNHNISDTTALKMLAILLDEKKKLKNQLHKELEELGVQIA